MEISFEYSINDLPGVRIFVQPITEGRPTPNFATSGSPVYHRGQGEGDAYFTIQEGEATVDQLRFRVTSINQNRTIFEFFVPVEFTFSSSTPFNPRVTNLPQRTIPSQDFPKFGGDDTTTEDDTTKAPRFGRVPDSADVEKRNVDEDGIVRISYTTGHVRVIEPPKDANGAEYEYIISPEGDTAGVPVLTQDVQRSTPPEFIGDNSSRANQEWLTALNDWLIYHRHRLLDQIKAILNTDEALKRYKRYEQTNTSTIYGEISLRMEFIERLTSSRI